MTAVMSRCAAIYEVFTFPDRGMTALVGGRKKDEGGTLTVAVRGNKAGASA